MVNITSLQTGTARRGVWAIRHRRNFWAGAIFLLTGAGFSILAGRYPIGSAARMGAGFFPLCLGILLAIFGLLVMLAACSRRAEPVALPAWQPQKLFGILGATLLFALLLEPAGLIVSLVLLVLIASRAGDRFSLLGTLINALVLVALNLAVFIWGLELTIPIWPAFISS